MQIYDGMRVNQSTEALVRTFINFNICFILIPETLIWIAFTYFDLHLSSIHKLLVLFFLTLYLILFHPVRQLKLAFLFIVFSFSSVYSVFLTQNLSHILVSFGDIFRLLVLFSAYYYCWTLVSQEKVKGAFFSNFIWISFIVISINLILGALGFGNDQRSLGIGTRGFFNSGNDISTITGIVAAFILSEKFEKGWKPFLCYFTFFLYLAYLLNTKSVLAALLIVVIIIPFYGNIRRVLKKAVFYRLGFFVVSLPFLTLIAYYALDALAFWDRYFVFMDQFQNDSWITFLLSRRDENLLAALSFVDSNFSSLNFLFGYSPGLFLDALPHRSEIDPFDLFFYYGVIGLCSVYSWFSYVTIFSYLRGSSKNSQNFHLYRGLFMSNLYLFLQSITAGHVFTSAIVCIFLGVLNAIMYLKPIEID